LVAVFIYKFCVFFLNFDLGGAAFRPPPPPLPHLGCPFFMTAISVVTFQQQREKQDGRKVYSARSGTAPSDSLGAFHISD